MQQRMTVEWLLLRISVHKIIRIHVQSILFLEDLEVNGRLARYYFTRRFVLSVGLYECHLQISTM